MDKKKKITLQIIFIILVTLIALIFSSKEANAIFIDVVPKDGITLTYDRRQLVNLGATYGNLYSSPYIYCINNGWEYDDVGDYLELDTRPLSAELSYMIFERYAGKIL